MPSQYHNYDENDLAMVVYDPSVPQTYRQVLSQIPRVVRNIERTGSIARAIAYATGASSGAKMVYSGYKRGRDAVTEYFQTKRLRRDRGENIFPQGSLIKNMPRYGS